MKNIIFLLFTSLLASSLIVGCGGSSSGGGDSDSDSANGVIQIPGGGEVSTVANTVKPVVKVTPGCEDKDATLPGCKK